MGGFLNDLLRGTLLKCATFINLQAGSEEAYSASYQFPIQYTTYNAGQWFIHSLIDL